MIEREDIYLASYSEISQIDMYRIPSSKGTGTCRYDTIYFNGRMKIHHDEGMTVHDSLIVRFDQDIIPNGPEVFYFVIETEDKRPVYLDEGAYVKIIFSIEDV